MGICFSLAKAADDIERWHDPVPSRSINTRTPSFRGISAEERAMHEAQEAGRRRRRERSQC